MRNLARTEREGGLTAGRPTDVFGFDPFRNFFSNLSQFHGLEISRTDQGYQVEVPVPGYKPDQIEVTLDNGVLQVLGKNERRSFTRSLALPEEIDSENIEANVEHGIADHKHEPLSESATQENYGARSGKWREHEANGAKRQQPKLTSPR